MENLHFPVTLSTPYRKNCNYLQKTGWMMVWGKDSYTRLAKTAGFPICEKKLRIACSRGQVMRSPKKNEFIEMRGYYALRETITFANGICLPLAFTAQRAKVLACLRSLRSRKQWNHIDKTLPPAAKLPARNNWVVRKSTS